MLFNTKKHFNLFCIVTIFFVVFSITFSSSAYATTGVPSTISYQGHLTDSGGNLLGGAGTPYYFKFSFWDSATVGAGTKLWPSTSPSSVPLTVRQGVFNVDIGDTTAGYPDTLNYDFNTNSKIYLQVEISSDNITFETLSPRSSITSSAFSQVADRVVGTSQSSFGTTTPITNSLISAISTGINQTIMTIKGFVGQVANLFNIQDSSGNSLFTVTAGGNVGVGTSTPGDKLHIVTAVNSTGFRVTNSTGAYGVSIGTGNGQGGFINFIQNSGQNVIKSAGTTMLTLNGNIEVRLNKPLNVNEQIIQALDNGSIGQGLVQIRGGNVGNINSNGGDVRIYGGTGNGVGLAGNVILAHTGTVAQGNVGIGTASPSQKLTLDGTSQYGIVFQNSGTNKTFLGQSFGNDQWITGSVAGDFNIRTENQKILFSTDAGTTAHMVINASSGNVGIGTTAPSDKLMIQGPNTNTDTSFGGSLGITMQNSNNTVGNYASINNNAANGIVNSGIYFKNIDQVYAGAIDFSTRATAGNYGVRMRLDQSGNLGIGNTSPVSKLTVGALSNWNLAGVDTAIKLSSGGYGLIIQRASDDSVLQVQESSSNFVIKTNYHTSGAYLPIFITPGGNQPLVLQSSGSGNVGIGTTTPGAKLSVTGNGATSATYSSIFTDSANNSYFRTRDDGKVFVGVNDVTNSASILNVNGDTYTSGNLVVGGIAYLGSLSSPAGVNLRLSTYNSPYVYITRDITNSQDLSFGIGTSTPSQKLDVWGNLNIATSSTPTLLANTGTGGIRFGFLTGAGANLIVDANGNVTVASDERLKNIQSTFTRGLADIEKINPIIYKWKSETGYDTLNNYAGFSAQNVQSAIPEAVGTSSSGFLNLADRPILAAVVNAIKEIGSVFVKIENGVAYMTNIFVDHLTVGSQSKPTGITIYDTVTGAPYCLQIKNGVEVILQGVCESQITPNIQVNVNSSSTSILDSSSTITTTSIPDPVSTSTATSTDPIIDPIVSSTSTSETISTPVTDPIPTPVIESTTTPAL